MLPDRMHRKQSSSSNVAFGEWLTCHYDLEPLHARAAQGLVPMTLFAHRYVKPVQISFVRLLAAVAVSVGTEFANASIHWTRHRRARLRCHWTV